MSFPTYGEYKDSGVEWLGDVPAHWDIRRLSTIAKIISGYPFDASLFELEGVPVIRMSDFAGGRIFREDAKRVEFAPPESLAMSGDILLGLSGSISNYATVKPDDIPIAVNQRVAIVRKNQSEFQLVPWLLQSKEFAQQILADLPATTILNVSMGQLRKCKFSLPPQPEEQTAIATFLDRETAKIDALIAEQERLITLLKEKRQAVISHAVTKGLNPDASMKDSGVEWLGEVPAHWSTCALKRCTNLLKDGTHLPPQRTSTGVPLLSVRNIINGEFGLLEDDSLISESDYQDLCRAFVPEAGDVLLAIVGATLGKVAMVPDGIGNFHIQRSLAVLRPSEKTTSAWLALVFQSIGFQALLWEHTGFSAQPGIYLGTLSAFKIPLPPLAERGLIADHVGEQKSFLNAMVAEAEKAVTLLNERRSALISAAVTGKIDVRKKDEVKAL